MKQGCHGSPRSMYEKVVDPKMRPIGRRKATLMHESELERRVSEEEGEDEEPELADDDAPSAKEHPHARSSRKYKARMEALFGPNWAMKKDREGDPKFEEKTWEGQQTNRWGNWQAIKKGTRQHFGNRTVVFTNLHHETMRAVLTEDFKLHEFEFEPSLRGQNVLYIVQSMDLELEEKLNDPMWRRIYLLEYEDQITDWFVALSVDEGGRFLKTVTNWEVDAEGMPFPETLAVYQRGILNCDNDHWKANVR